MTLPDTFKFRRFSTGEYLTATRFDSGCFLVSSNPTCTIDNLYYAQKTVEDNINYGLWCLQYSKPNNALEDLKKFTEETGSSIFIIDGKYQVSKNNCGIIAYANSDEDLVKLMDAIRTLEKALNA